MRNNCPIATVVFENNHLPSKIVRDPNPKKNFMVVLLFIELFLIFPWILYPVCVSFYVICLVDNAEVFL